jgi:tetratricopeptide (TPR) repeat protein
MGRTSNRLRGVRALLLSAALSAVGWCASTVHAEARSAALLDARAQHEHGVVAFAQGRYTEAIAAFQTADKLLPDAALSFNIAKAYEALHDYQRALAFYREYLRRAPTAPDRGGVELHVGDLARELHEQPAQRVELRSQPHGASVWVDDEPVGTAPVALLLPSGRHRASFRLAGYRTEQLSFEVSAASAPLELRAALEPLGSPHGAAEREAPSQAIAATSGKSADKPRTLLRDLGFTAMLASVAVLGTAIAFEAMRSDAEQRARQEQEQVRFARTVDSMQNKQTLARVFAGASGGLAALGVTLLVISSNKAGAREDARVALHCQPTKCRAELSGAF